MLNDFSSTHQSETDRFTDANGRVAHMYQSSYSFGIEIEPTAHLDNNSSNTVSTVSSSNNSTSSSSTNEQQIELSNHNLSYQESINLHQNSDHNSQPTHSHPPLPIPSHHHHQQQQQNHQNRIQTRREGKQAHYFVAEQDSNYNNSSDKYNSITRSSRPSPTTLSLNDKSKVNTLSSIESMSVDTTQHNSMIPTAHGSELQVHYSLSTPKAESSPSNMALNFSHDPLQAGHHGQSTSNVQHHSEELKTQSNNSFELDSASLMQTAAVGMNMWKSTMGLNHFKHPVISDHNFLPSSDLNSFSSWTHGGNLGSHQPSNMPHHILDSQHLIGYSQHQRSLPLSNQDLMGASIKGHSPAEQASFMLNTINHQASTSQNSSSNHQTNQIDNLNLRSNALDHSTYNLSMNDNQIYTSSRSEGRSQPNAIKPSFMVSDRSVHMSLTNHHHHNQLSYHSAEQTSIQSTTSHQVASSSSGSSSKTEWRCSFCSEVFPLRTVYQAHLKTHSQDKGNYKS